MKRRKVLVVAMLDSVHTARWLAQFVDENIDFYLYPSRKFKKINPDLCNLLDNQKIANFRTLPFFNPIKFAGYLDFLLFVTVKKISFLDLRRLYLTWIISRKTFDYIHALEIQGAGYLCLEAIPKNFDKDFIVTNWGSDISYFSQFSEHKNKIVNLLRRATKYSAECERDYKLAKELGFTGINLTCIPNAGGFTLTDNKFNFDLPSTRTMVVLKGYGGEFGRANILIECVEEILHENLEYQYFFYSVTDELLPRMLELKNKFQKNVNFSSRRNPIPREELIKYFLKARVYVGASISDGVSTSFLEAIVTGAYPIQTDTSCANEWVSKGVVASVIPLDEELISKEIRYALISNKMVDNAFEKNQEIARKYLDKNVVEQSALQFYRKIE